MLHNIKVPLSSDERKKLETVDEVKIKCGNETFKLTRQRFDYDHANALKWMFLPTFIEVSMYILIVLISGMKELPLKSDDLSFSGLVIVIATVGTLITFTCSFWLGKKKNLNYAKTIQWRNFPAIAVAVTIIVLVSFLFGFYMMDRIFKDLMLNMVLATVLCSVLFGIMNYVTLYFMFSISPMRLTSLLTNIMLGGVTIAMLTNSDTHWWKQHLSFLGSSQATSSWQFNITLILSAMLMISLVDSVFISLRKTYGTHKGLHILRWLLIFMALSLAFVGYFTVDGPRNFPKFHNIAAKSMVISVIVMIMMNGLLIPKVTKEFSAISYLAGLGLVVFSIIHANGHITLTVFEIVSFLIAFTWIMLLFQFLNHLMEPDEEIFKIEVVDIENDDNLINK